MRLRVRPGVHRLFLVLGLLVVGWSTAQAFGPTPVKNWAAPSTWTPPSAQVTGRRALVIPPTPLIFIPLTPCRLIDTRAGSGFPAGYGPPSIGGGAQRTFTITGQCLIPTGAQAVSFNFTVWGPTTRGDLRVFPAGGATPVVSTLNWEAGILALANAAVVPLGAGAAITVLNDGGTVDIFADVNGYYGNSLSQGNSLILSGTVNDNFMVGASNLLSNFANFGFGLQGSVDGPPSLGSLHGSSGVVGIAPDMDGAYGIKGSMVSRFNPYPAGSWGVVGGGGDGGVYGQADPAKANSVGVFGSLLDRGFLGGPGGKLAYKVGATSYGVFSNGDFGGTGAKFFVEPHPTDADKVIRYVALEGPEAGTYFRGTARTSGKRAVIEVPESFRFVTDEEGLTVQLTPLGDLVILAVVEQDLNRIVIRSSAEVSFHYLVHGVRRAFKGHEAIADGSEFRPTSPSSRLPSYLPEEARKRLIENGTYNRDGTVNLGMAQRRGWTKVWEEEARRKSAD